MCCYLALFVREHQIRKPSWCAQGQLYCYTLIVIVDTCADINICNCFVFSVLCLWFVMVVGGLVPWTPRIYVESVVLYMNEVPFWIWAMLRS